MDDSEWHLETFIQGVLISHEYERVFDEAELLPSDLRVVWCDHWSAIGWRKSKQLDRACLWDALHEGIRIFFIQLESLYGAYISDTLLDRKGRHPKVLDLFEILAVQPL